MESQVNNSTHQNAWVADKIGAITEVCQVGLHQTFHFSLP